MLVVEVYTPEKTVFKGEASSVKLPGVSGMFEILKGHAPLISVLVDGTLSIKQEGDKDEFKIDSGFVEVLNNQVSILVEGVQ